jgi:quercetin dioxygenase-like cupin family protein
MPHDKDNSSHWHEITGTTTKAGLGVFKHPPMPYDSYMEEQGVPIYREIGISKVQNLALKPWKRLGGNGCFIQLYGTEGLWGMYVIEVPGGGALNVEKHLYEKVMYVIEGRGTTEVWWDGEEKTTKQTFEWQKGSMFTVPMNTMHRIVNASSSPALILAGTSAPNIMNLMDDLNFVFNSGQTFKHRYDGGTDYFKPKDDLAPDPVRGLAMRRTNLLPDIVNCELPLDNRRSPGYRRIEPHMGGNRFYQWIGQHETGRYSKAHSHGSAAVLICLRGKGYTYTWPAKNGPTPWKDGKREEIKRVDYEPVGMVSAAPMAGDWFHQHFGTSAEPLRLTAWFGPNNARGRKPAVPGMKNSDMGAIDIRDGGSAIPYDEEDPYIRAEFEETLRKNGATSRMDPEIYVPGNEIAKKWSGADF